MKKGYLYVITNNINGKQYVGKTYDSVEIRFARHLYDSTRVSGVNRPLYKAILKYGKENFSVQEAGIFEEGNLEIQEISLIEKLGTYSKGYNATLGGDGSRKPRNYTQQELLDRYKEVKSASKLAKEFKVSNNVIRKDLGSDNLTKWKARPIKIVELDEIYASAAECARALINAETTSNKDVNSVASNILTVIRGVSLKSYLGFTFIEA